MFARKRSDRHCRTQVQRPATMGSGTPPIRLTQPATSRAAGHRELRRPVGRPPPNANPTPKSNDLPPNRSGVCGGSREILTCGTAVGRLGETSGTNVARTIGPGARPCGSQASRHEIPDGVSRLRVAQRDLIQIRFSWRSTTCWIRTTRPGRTPRPGRRTTTSIGRSDPWMASPPTPSRVAMPIPLRLLRNPAPSTSATCQRDIKCKPAMGSLLAAVLLNSHFAFAKHE
jgi:hypothetical protein